MNPTINAGGSSRVTRFKCEAQSCHEIMLMAQREHLLKLLEDHKRGR